MQEKQKDLTSVKQKQVLNKILQTLSERHPSMYYLSTVEIANQIKRHIDETGELSLEEQALVKPLELREIQILLSLH